MRLHLPLKLAAARRKASGLAMVSVVAARVLVGEVVRLVRIGFGLGGLGLVSGSG